jgi:gliding motility-associated-like protein
MKTQMSNIDLITKEMSKVKSSKIKIQSGLKPIIRALHLFIIMTIFNAVYAEVPNPCSASSSCTAGDFILDSVYLASDLSGTRLNTNDCNGTLPVAAYYVVRIENKTSSQRIGIYVDARVSTGGVISNLTYCFDHLMPANAIQTLIVPTPIYWDCSTPIFITESIIVWSTASGAICPGNILDCAATNGSKCRGGGTLPVGTPLVSNFTYNGVCNPNQSIQTITYTDSSFGGNYPNVTYLWNFGAGATPATANTKGPHIVTYATTGTKTVTLTVTNPDGSFDTKTKSVNVVSCCTFNATCPPAPFAGSYSCEQSIPPAASNLAQLQALGFIVNVCNNLGISYLDQRINGNCPNNYTINRTYTIFDDLNSNQIKDANESFINCVQAFTITDTTKPIITGTPSNTIVSCSSAVPQSSIGSVSATDNCGGVVTVTVADVISNQTCANRYTITRTWTATDVCGNNSTSSQIITVNDQTPPVITGTPSNTTVSCSSAVPQSSIGSVSATDNCGGTVTVTVADVITNQTCANRYTITRTWTATDVCGNSSTSSQIITVNDQTPPVITGTPSNTTVSCSSAVPQSSIGSVSATDNCGGTVTVTVADVITNQTCANRYTITRTWTATDVCGNNSASSQIITVNDQTPPVITGTPSNTTVSCSSAVPQSSIGSVSATDNCGGTVTVTVADVISNQTCANRYTITRTWTATDVCGNSSTSSQIITVNDQTPPVITGTPSNTTVSCSSAVPQSSIGSVSATDNCGGVVTVTVADVITNQTCANRYTITRTWTATDVCGNSSTSSQIITVNDNVNPTFNGQLPGDITVNCNSIPNPVILTASDNCGQATVSFSESSTPGGCSGAGGIIRTWTATDACNNSIIHIQHVTVQDTTRPVISGTPQNINVNCSADVPVASNTSVTATDNCAGIVYITVADVISNQTCANRYTITRTWTATDACSNSSTSSQTITVNDIIPPVITGVPSNATVSCAADVPQASITSVTATDNCAGNITIRVADVITNQTCANRYTITRTWTATDVCGNSSTSSQIITVNDQTPPVITGTPSNTTVSCSSTVPQSSIGSVSATDNCGGAVTVTVADVISNQTCVNRYTIIRTWTATDVCGNSSTSSQSITVNDQTPPTIMNTPITTTVSCSSAVPQSSIGSVSATDNCGGTVTITVTDVNSNQTCANRYTITRTWTATDVCGNSSTSTQTIIVNDQTPPTINGTPANTTVSCVEDVPQASITSVTATDNCAGNVTVTVADVISNQTCANRYTITRTWTATDVCGNSSTSSQIITVNDQTPPLITGTPANINFNCSEDVPQGSIAGVTTFENCIGAVTVTVADVISGQTCANKYTITRTWTATDVCGNSSTSSQIITVNDNINPTFNGQLPGDITVNCNSIPNPVTLTASDNCGQATVTFSENSTPGGCSGAGGIIRTWTATDACNNTTIHIQNVTVQDTTKPIITGTPEDITVNCSEDVPVASNTSVNATDNCAGTVYITVNDVITNQICTNKYSITRTWTATDACSNSTTSSQTITVNDTIKPVFNEQLPGDITADCDEIPEPLVLTANDNCGAATVTFSEVSSPGGCSGAGGIVRTWTATDACNNTTVHIQNVTVQDTTKPVISGTPEDIIVNCSTDVPVASNTSVSVNDNCTGTVTITVNDVITNQTCANKYTISRTWTATDACSNSSSTSQMITVNDTIKPVITETPGNITVSCAEDVPVANIEEVRTTDNCLGTVTVTVADVVNEGICANKFTVTRTFTATDVCGNSSVSTQTITVNDTIKPVITETPENITVSCASDIPEANNQSVEASDNCAGIVTVTVADVVKQGDCANNFTITRTWTATDVCGNSSTSTQIITVNDTIKPVITGTPVNITVSCTDEIPEASNESVEATDNCSGNVTVTVADVVNEGSCANKYTVTRTWTATDICGNTSTSTQTITVNDTIKPVITETPGNITVSCGSDIPEASIEDISVSDNCSGTVTVRVADVVNQGSCANKFSVIRTWTATDVCGNSSTSSQIITVNDTIKPFIDGTPQNITVSCSDDIPTASITVVSPSDNCGGAVTVTVADLVNVGTCINKFTITRTWTATDICGNSSSTTQTITINDNINPVFVEELPKSITVCALLQEPEILTATDNCGTASVVFTETVDSSSANGVKIYTRIWTATDLCSNKTSHQQWITVNPTTSSYIERTVCDTLISGGVIVGGQVFTEPGLYKITVQNVFGCDSFITLNLKVSVCVPLGKDTIIYDTLPVFTTSTICELSLPPRGEVIVKSCDGETSGIETYGSWTIDQQTNCLVYTAGPLEGNDTLCIIACDTARQCNTTTVIITVTGLPPIAEDDCVEEIEKNQEITIYVLENDIDPDKDQVFVQSIVTEPKHGTVTIGQEGQNIIYTPNKNYCGRDTLYYAACDGDDGCDTAMVCIYVKCDCVLPQVITPNGDGYNDHLVFPCISEGAKLIIWHRNGLIIYESDNYKNDWNGTYKGQETPGGTYFYNIEYRDEEAKEMIVKQNYLMVIK